MPTDDDFQALVAKVDALAAALEPPTTPKEDARDVSLAKGTSFFKTYLEKVLPKEKLDTLTFDELVLAAELKAQIQPPKLNPAPPIDKTDAADPRPAWLIPEVA